MHPASKQRSEGEKVRVGDDLILVSVSSERYLVRGGGHGQGGTGLCTRTSERWCTGASCVWPTRAAGVHE